MALYGLRPDRRESSSSTSSIPHSTRLSELAKMRWRSPASTSARDHSRAHAAASKGVLYHSQSPERTSAHRRTHGRDPLDTGRREGLCLPRSRATTRDLPRAQRLYRTTKPTCPKADDVRSRARASPVKASSAPCCVRAPWSPVSLEAAETSPPRLVGRGVGPAHAGATRRRPGAASVKKTGRVVIVHERRGPAGSGAELARSFAEQALTSLQRRCCASPGTTRRSPTPSSTPTCRMRRASYGRSST